MKAKVLTALRLADAHIRRDLALVFERQGAQPRRETFHRYCSEEKHSNSTTARKR